MEEVVCHTSATWTGSRGSSPQIDGTEEKTAAVQSSPYLKINKNFANIK